MTLPEASAKITGRRALLVFSGRADLPWLRLLRPGFRHCFLLVEEPEGWILCDPLSHVLDLRLVRFAGDVDLVAFYARHGMRAIETRISTVAPRPAPLGAFTCVEAIKRVLGIRRRRLLTPWQLYRYVAGARAEGRKFTKTENIP